MGTQDYVDGTLILRTLLPGAESLVELTDFLPVDGTGRIVRRARALRGPVTISVEVVPGPEARDVHAWSDGVVIDRLRVTCGLPMQLATAPPPSPARPLHRLVAVATTVLDTGEEIVVSLDPGALDPLAPDAARDLEGRAGSAWRRVSERVEVPGRYGAEAARSAIVVAALAGNGGAPITSPVTSLPRIIGGERNTDGRTASPVTAAGWALIAARIGLAEESEAATRWLMGALEHEPPLPAALAPDGDMPSGEASLSGLAGWRRSQPVVVGSNAGERRSLEPGAAALSAASRLARGPSGPAVLSKWARVVVHADWLADHWMDPDASIWDVRGPERGWHSPRLSARRALADAVAEARRRNPLDLDAAGWQASLRDVETWWSAHGVGDGGVLVAGVAGSADAALCRVGMWGPWPVDDTVSVATSEHIARRLGQGPWVSPYAEDVDDGLPGAEPASVTATLWMAQVLAGRGRWDEAHERIDAALTLAGDVHLLPESVDATLSQARGNQPAAGAHVALLEAAVAMAGAPS